MEYNYNDGGRSKYFKAECVNDCVTRAIAIATERDYKEVYNEIKSIVGYSPRNGILYKDVKKVMHHFGGTWTATMHIGQGCRVHVKPDELPAQGRYVLNLSKHCASWIDGTLQDTYDCSRDGKRLVYGFWKFD